MKLETPSLYRNKFTVDPSCVEQVKKIEANVAMMRRIPKGKINEHMYAPFALMVEGKSSTSVIDHWKKHLLGVKL